MNGFIFRHHPLFLLPRMKNISIYTLKNTVAAGVMFMSLAWLTISLPYVYSFQQDLAKQESKSGHFDSPAENEESNPLANTTEEKAPSSSSIAEEYLHHKDEHNYILSYILSHDSRHSYDVYIAYHGEVSCPPPNFLS